MSFIHCLGLLLLTVSWLWKFYIYTPPGDFWLPLVVAGLVLLSFPPRSMRLVTDYLYGGGGSNNSGGKTAIGDPGFVDPTGRFPKWALLYLVPFLLSLFTLPRQLAVGPLVLSLAVLGGVLWGEGNGRFRPVSGCILGGAVLTLQGYVLPLIAVFSAHVHTVPLFGYILYPFVRLFDPSAAFSGGVIFVSSIEEIFGFGVSLEKLAFLPMILYFISILISRIFNLDFSRSLGRLIISFIVYGAVRFLVIFFTVVILNNEKLFWQPRAILLSLVPLPVFLAWISPYGRFPFSDDSTGREKAGGKGIPVKVAVLFTVAFFLLVGSLTFHDPGRMKKGRVLFDEKYSDWEWTTQRYDRNWYGQKSGYNYYCLGEYLGHFFEVELGFEPFTLDYLSRFDVVIIKTPTQFFTQDELDAVEKYVNNGGGLFLIGDHTNVFGTSTNLNPLAARFGLRFNYDSTYQLATMALSYYTPPPVAAHPSNLHVPEFLFATGCSMDSPLFGENALVGYGLKGIMLDYSQRSFFPTKDEREYEFGFLMQMGGVKSGKGRVLGHTDSTVFSNFFMFVPGKPETFLGAIDWLNRTNRWHRLNIIFFIFGAAVLVIGGISLRGRGGLGAAGAVMFGLVLGLVLSIHLFEALKRTSYPPLEPKREMKTISFDRDPSWNDMPLRSLVRNAEASLHTFYVWTQRLGFFPSLHPTLKESLESSQIAVVVNPRRSLSIDEIDAVVDFCRDGGNLLLISGPASAGTGTNDFLGIFRMTMGPAAADTTEIMNIKGERICEAIKAGTVHGGIPLLTLPGGRVVMAYEKLGQGRFYVFTDSYIFSQAFSGPTSVTPTLIQREVFELEYQILEILSGEREPDDINPYSGAAAPDTTRALNR